MENNDIKKALECCLTTSEGDCIACGYRGKKDGLFITCTNCLMADALALINKQETEYNELYELLQTYKADSEAYRSYSKTLEKENEGLKTLLDESYDTQNSLTEENERLRAENEMLLNIKKLNLDKVIADTVRKMQERLEAHCVMHYWGGRYVPEYMIDQIAKEMLEGEK